MVLGGQIQAGVEAAVVVFNLVGAAVVAWGVVEALSGFILAKARRAPDGGVGEGLRQRLGSHLLLGLEVFIAGDIIGTVVSPSWEKVGILAVIVAIRTVLSFFLQREMRPGRSPAP